MSRPRRTPSILPAAFGLGTAAGLFAFVLGGSAASDETSARMEILRGYLNPAESAPHVAPPSPPSAQTREEILAAVPCFGCHSLARFTTETRFGHKRHEGAGHCHVCHAFTSHIEVIVRKELCATCHAEKP